MKILALDLATKTGWAHSVGVSGVWDFRVRKDESSGMRLLRFRSKLKEIHELEGIDFVAYETAIAVNARRGATVGSEMQGVLKEWCESSDVDYKGYGISEIKRHATGKGNASKDAMIEAARIRFVEGCRFGVLGIVDDNHADALWLLDLATVELN